jgi:hypothetical protein
MEHLLAMGLMRRGMPGAAPACRNTARRQAGFLCEAFQLLAAAGPIEMPRNKKRLTFKY